MNETSYTGRRLPALAVLFAVAFMCYGNSLNADFHLDDLHQIVNNQYVKSLRNVPSFFVNPERGSFYSSARIYRPVTFGTFALSYAMSGYDRWGYHLFNIIVHALNACLVYLVLASALRGLGREESRFAALAPALLFAVHPLQTDAVTYISGRSILLASFFCLLALLAFIEYRRGRLSATLFFAASLALSMLGMMSKEAAVCLPGLMFAYDLAEPRARRWLFLAYLPAVTAVAAFLLVKAALHSEVGDSNALGAWRYFITESHVWLLYARLFVFPFNQNMDYYMKPLVSADFLSYLSFGLVASAVYIIYRIRKTRPDLAFCGLWAILALAPESSVIPIPDVVREYRMYLSVGGLAGLVCLASPVVRLNVGIKAALALTLALFCVLTVGRNRVWATEYSLWADVAGKSPLSARAHANLGKALIADNRFADAVAELDLALKYTDPSYDQSLSVRNLRGICLNNMGKTGQAVDEFRGIIALAPDYKEAYMNLSQILYSSGRYAEAAETLSRELERYPDYARARLLLGKTYAKTDRIKDALSQMEEAVRIDPSDYAARYDLAVLYAKSGMPALGRVEAEAAARIASTEQEKRAAEELMGRIDGFYGGGR